MQVDVQVVVGQGAERVDGQADAGHLHDLTRDARVAAAPDLRPGADHTRTPTGCDVTTLVPGVLLALSGRLDVHSAADVRFALLEALAGGTGELVLDLSAVTAVDATGLGVLVATHRRAGRVARLLVLRDVAPPLHRLLTITRLDRVLRCRTS